MKKNILFIGGSYGIGLEAAKLLSKDNNLIIASRSSDELKDLEVKHLSFDASKDEIKDLDLPETLDALVYFPGSINLKPFKMLSPESFQEITF